MNRQWYSVLQKYNIFWNRQGKNQNLADKQIALTEGGTLNLTILTSGGYGVQIQSQGVNVLLNISIGWEYEMTPAELTKKMNSIPFTGRNITP